MEVLVIHLRSVFDNLPKKLLPRKLTSDDCERLFRDRHELVGSPGPIHSKDGKKWYFICGNKVKTAEKLILDQLASDLLKDPMVREGGTLNIHFWLQDEVRQFLVDRAILRQLHRGCHLTQDDFKEFYEIRLKIGSTITVKTCLKEWKARGLPVQVFLNSRQSAWTDDGCKTGSDSLTRQAREKKLRAAVNKHKLPVYIHGAYTVRLSQPKERLDPHIADLKSGNIIGARGVVVHVGHITSDLPERVAVDRMQTNVERLLVHATEGCPLLIETPAGQGKKDSEQSGEILSRIEEFIEFYQRFSEEDRKKLGVCIDTCHISAAGYNPFHYIRYFDMVLPGVLKLVHYNDSEHPRGCRVDRHFPVGGGFKSILLAATTDYRPKNEFVGDLGYIGIPTLKRVAEYCIERGIHMVTE